MEIHWVGISLHFFLFFFINKHFTEELIWSAPAVICYQPAANIK